MTTFYEARQVTVVPLLLDDVSEGELPRSRVPFFTVPSDLLRVIIQHVDSDSLSSFALASWDCLQLTRTRRFASVLMGPNHSSTSLITKLRDEAQERVRSQTGRTSRPSIGVCIRSITMDSTWPYQRFRLQLQREMGRHGLQLSRGEIDVVRQRRQRIEKMFRDFFACHIPTLIRILEMRPRILPHLEVLKWEDSYVTTRQILSEDFSSLPIKILRLCRGTRYDTPNKTRLFMNLAPDWLLPELDPNLPELDRNLPELDQPFIFGGATSCCVNILRLCASTLLSLTWQDLTFTKMSFSLMISDSQVLQFPCLRQLRLGNVEFKDSASLATLLGTNLVTLSADTESTSIHQQCFKNRGTIPSLKIFVWETLHIPVDHPLDFLRANQQLYNLRIPHPLSSVVLETRLLPLLSSSFKKLCCLNLVWEGAMIPASAVKIISTITSLEQIHLSAGNQKPEYDWAIDHQLMRICLSSLPHLQKVAFSCDTYSDPLDNVMLYYAEKYFDLETALLLEGEDLDSEESRDRVWERLHKERILEEARKYIGAFPNLDWLYMGQITMSVVESQTQRGSRRAIPLSLERVKRSSTSFFPLIYGRREVNFLVHF